MAPKGRFRLAPHISSFATLAPDRFSQALSPRYYAYGGVLEYGASDRINVIAGMQRAVLEGNEEEFLFHADVKFGEDGIREAMSIGYGIFPGIGLHQINVSAYTNWYYNRRIYYCISPNLSLLHFYSIEGEDDPIMALNAVVNNSLTFEFADRFYIRPQAGVNVLGLLVKMAIFTYGVSGGLAF